MLAIGRALMARPTLLLLDEPSLGLAPIVVDEIYDRLDLLLRRRPGWPWWWSSRAAPAWPTSATAFT